MRKRHPNAMEIGFRTTKFLVFSQNLSQERPFENIGIATSPSAFLRINTIARSEQKAHTQIILIRAYKCRPEGVVWSFCIFFGHEPPHDKTNKMTYAPSENSDQPGHPPSLIRVFAVSMKKAWASLHSKDPDQTGRMPRLIWVFTGRTGHFVSSVVR